MALGELYSTQLGGIPSELSLMTSLAFICLL